MKEITRVLISFLIIFALLVSVHGSWSEYSFYYAKYNTIFIDSILKKPIERIASYD